MNDINLDNREWTPIGHGEVSYTGTFDGDGKAISGLNLETTAENNYEGLFGSVDGGTVKNFTIAGAIKITADNGSEGRLGVIGKANAATISGIESSVSITVADTVTKYKYVGGIVGDLGSDSTVEKCVWYGTINAGKCTAGYFAGIVGRMGPSTITNCASYGTLTSSEGVKGNVHGIVGWANHNDLVINNCLFAGTMDNPETAKVSAIGNIGDNVQTPYSKLSGLYYKEDSATNAILKNSGTAPEELAQKVTSVKAEALSNGEAVSLLNEGNSEKVWKLDTFTIGGTKVQLPGFEGEEVVVGKCAEAGCTGIYSDNGFCSADAAHYEAAKLNGDIYEISNAGQLFWFAAKVNAGDSDINGKLMKDINLEDKAWTPIGISNAVNITSTVDNMDTTTQAYRGIFDGNEKTISGLNLKTTAENGNEGLFGLVIGGTVKNFTVQGEIQVVNDNADNGRLGVIGYADYATISGIESSVNITVADNVTKYKYVGGIVGDLGTNSTAEKCVWYGTINAGKCTTGYFAGIVGRMGPSTITNCASYGTLKSVAGAKANMHGIVGWANHNDLIINNCLFAGTMDNPATAKVSAIGNIGNNVKTPYSKLSGLYYKEGSAANATLKNSGTAPDELAQKVTAVKAEALSNGEAVLLLNGGNSEAVWKLDTFTIGTTETKLPGFEGETVASGTKCAEEGCTGFYDENGFCSADPTHYEAVTVSVAGVYEISNGGQLFSFAQQVNAGNSGDERINVTLIKDINLDNKAWTSIGSESKPFKGVFDGNGKTISELKMMTTDAAYEGLFGYVLNSTVKDFTVNGEITVAVSQSQSAGNLGVIGYAGEGTNIQKITSSIKVTVDETVQNGAYQYVGGIVGNFASGLLEQCIWDGSIETGSWTINRFAGIAGRMGANASITNCASYGTLKSSNTKNLQGIAGWASNPQGIRNSLFAGTMTYEGTENANFYAIASVGDSCTADKLTSLYYVNTTGYVAGYPVNGTMFAGATAVTSDEASSRTMVWKLNGNKKGNWKYNTTNKRPEFVGEEITTEPNQ